MIITIMNNHSGDVSEIAQGFSAKQKLYEKTYILSLSTVSSFMHKQKQWQRTVHIGPRAINIGRTIHDTHGAHGYIHIHIYDWIECYHGPPDDACACTYAFIIHDAVTYTIC